MRAAHALLLLEEDPRIVTLESVTIERSIGPTRSIVRHKFNTAQYAAAAALGLVVAGIGAVGLQWWLGSRFIEATDNAYVESDISMISPQIAGYVKEVRVAENQEVRRGDVLVKLVDDEYAAKVTQARAEVEVRQAALEIIAAKFLLEAANTEAAAAAVLSAEADRTRINKDLERSTALLVTQSVSRQQHDVRQAEASRADAAVASAKALRTAQMRQVDVLQANRKEANAKLQQAKAQLQLAEIDLANTLIRAPIDGIIGNRGIRIGQYVRAGTLLMSVVPTTGIYVVANFKETQLHAMKAGQRVGVQVDAYPDYRLIGRLDSIAPASGSRFSLLPPENAVGNFTKIVQRVPVRITLTPDTRFDGLLKPGLSVSVSVDTHSNSEADAPFVERSMSSMIGAAQAASVTVLPAAADQE